MDVKSVDGLYIADCSFPDGRTIVFNFHLGYENSIEYIEYTELLDRRMTGRSGRRMSVFSKQLEVDAYRNDVIASLA